MLRNSYIESTLKDVKKFYDIDARESLAISVLFGIKRVTREISTLSLKRNPFVRRFMQRLFVTYLREINGHPLHLRVAKFSVNSCNITNSKRLLIRETVPLINYVIPLSFPNRRLIGYPLASFAKQLVRSNTSRYRLTRNTFQRAVTSD